MLRSVFLRAAQEDRLHFSLNFPEEIKGYHDEYDKDDGCDAGAKQRLLANCLIHKIFQHLLGDSVVRDDAVTQGTYRNDISRRPAYHKPRFLTDCKDAV